LFSSSSTFNDSISTAAARLTVHAAAQHKFLAPLLGVRYLSVPDPNAPLMYSATTISNSQYHHSPVIAKEVAARKLTTLDLLRSGTTHTPTPPICCPQPKCPLISDLPISVAVTPKNGDTTVLEEAKEREKKHKLRLIMHQLKASGHAEHSNNVQGHKIRRKLASHQNSQDSGSDISSSSPERVTVKREVKVEDSSNDAVHDVNDNKLKSLPGNPPSGTKRKSKVTVRTVAKQPKLAAKSKRRSPRVHAEVDYDDHSSEEDWQLTPSRKPKRHTKAASAKTIMSKEESSDSSVCEVLLLVSFLFRHFEKVLFLFALPGCAFAEFLR
jgi:hypothetical protein